MRILQKIRLESRHPRTYCILLSPHGGQKSCAAALSMMNMMPEDKTCGKASTDAFYAGAGTLKQRK